LAIRIGILGYAQSSFELDWNSSIEDLVYETTIKALENCNLSIPEIDTVIQSGDDVMDGIAINHVYTIESAGAFLKEESKVERDGAWAIQYAIARLLSGKFETALVTGFSKSSQCHPSAFSGMMADPFYQRPVGVDGLTSAAIQAGYFMQRTGISEQEIAKISIQNRKNGLNNPNAMCAGDFRVEDVMNSAKLSTPIKKLDSVPLSDGACSIVIATEDYIKRNKLAVPFITGFGFSNHAYLLTYRDLSKVESAEVAARSAYKMAGTSAKNIDIAEIYGAFAHQDAMLYESLGFCSEGQGMSFFEETGGDGSLPVNPSGGVLCGHPIYAAGLVRIMETAKQLQGKSGKMQVKGAKTALAHSQGGLAMQNNIVYILEA